MTRWCAFLLFLTFLCLPAPADAWRWGAWRFRLKLQATTEFDSNVRRIAITKPASFKKNNKWSLIAGEPAIKSALDPVEVIADGVNKWSGLLRVAHRGKKHIFRAWYGFGYQRYFWVDRESHFSNRGNLLYYARPHRRFLIGVEINAGDLRRDNSEREYSNLLGLGRMLLFVPGGFQISLAAGGTGFTYRNKEEFPQTHIDGFSDGLRYSYVGEQYQLQVLKRWGRTLRASFRYGLTRLHYQFRNDLDSNKTDVIASEKPRTDLLHGFQLSARYLRGILLQVSYRFELMQSESVGESFYGHVVEGLLSLSLPWKFLLIFQGQLQLRTYTDGLSLNHNRYPVGQNPGEDENLASNFTIRLARNLTKQLKIQLRYRVYTNVFAGQSTEYLRHLISGGFSVQF